MRGRPKGVTTLVFLHVSYWFYWILRRRRGGKDELQAPADRRSDRTMTGGGRDHVAGGLDRGGFHRQLPPCVQTWHRLIHWPLVVVDLWICGLALFGGCCSSSPPPIPPFDLDWSGLVCLVGVCVIILAIVNGELFARPTLIFQSIPFSN